MGWYQNHLQFNHLQSNVPTRSTAEEYIRPISSSCRNIDFIFDAGNIDFMSTGDDGIVDDEVQCREFSFIFLHGAISVSLFFRLRQMMLGFIQSCSK